MAIVQQLQVATRIESINHPTQFSPFSQLATIGTAAARSSVISPRYRA
jgi:phosphoribosylformylglycinamidine (FGAM) synthase-like enzyme